MIDPISRHLHHHAGEHGPIMLMYHAIEPGNTVPTWPWAVSLDQFSKQLDFLATEGYATPTLAEVAASPEHFEGRTAIITFDDGYANNLAAADALKRRGMRASWFIVSGSIGKYPHWPSEGYADSRILSNAELQDLQASGMEIGSHTVNHMRLTELDDESLAYEVTHSKAVLEDRLCHEICSFAYPYGACEERTVAAVQLAGYTSACTTRTGWAFRDGDPYLLRRITVFNSDTTASFARKLSLGSHDVSWRNMADYALRRLRRR
jgi:peptidoglycan/xylan/chitin deacetylase (PgdA/CDA1 family)